MVEALSRRQSRLIAFVVLSLAVVGYFTGIQSPVKPGAPAPAAPVSPTRAVSGTGPSDGVPVLPATGYVDMPAATSARAKAGTAPLSALKSSFDRYERITIRPRDKQAALRARDRNRAFNGAPPTIPHPIDQRSDRACVACHSAGAKTASLRIPRMSHRFLANCTQCHVENNPRHMTAALFRENSFAGLPAPTAGSRAFPGAPPVIPHSTWMRNDCMSCHGPTGLYGLRTTHPWRQNCQQCHAPSAKLNQVPLGSAPQFLAPPKVEPESPANRDFKQTSPQ